LDADPGGPARVVLKGKLDAEAVGACWARIINPLRKASTSKVQVDVSGVSYCDGAGVGLLVELQRVAAINGGTAEITGLSAELEPLLRMATLQDPTGSQLAPQPRPPLVQHVGTATAAVLADMRDMISFVGELLVAFAWAARHPREVRWRDVWSIAEKVGVNALPVAVLLGFLIGAIIAFQTAGPLKHFGADANLFVADIVSAAVILELGPLITAILLAGRSGSAFAAELGTMKVTEELDALSTLGLTPVQFLIVPRIIAALVMTPVLAVFTNLVGLIGGYVVFASLGYSLSIFIQRSLNVVDYVDLLGGLFKTVVFAFLVAAVGCLRGLRTQQGPGAVGDSTTRAVVAGIVLIIVADGVLGTVYFYLGI
jgi:phospholipid/cholesterol/gamma-HCH transport system permease protein